MTAKKLATVRVAKHCSASPERVFDAWLDPETARKFLFATKTGKIVRAEIDARVGGAFVLVDRREGEDIEHTGTYLEIDRPRRLVFDFAVPKFSAQRTKVTVEVQPAAGGSRVTLTHDGVLPDYEERTRQGWTMILDGLTAAIK